MKYCEVFKSEESNYKYVAIAENNTFNGAEYVASNTKYTYSSKYPQFPLYVIGNNNWKFWFKINWFLTI